MTGPAGKPGRTGAVLLGAAVLAVGLAGLWALRGAPRSDRSMWPQRFSGNGERIYFTGTSASGTVIRATGGSRHMAMMGGGCVACHGADRQGGRLFPTVWVVAPPITAAALRGEGAEGHDDGDGGDDGGHGDHDGYGPETLARAITQGIEPDGERLDARMPRWRMAPQDLNDLVGYLLGPEG